MLLGWGFGICYPYKNITDVNSTPSDEINRIFTMWAASCLVFAISLGLEIAPNIKKATTKYGKGYFFTWFLIILVSIALSLISMGKGELDTIPCQAIFTLTVISCIFLLGSFVASVIVYFGDEDSGDNPDAGVTPEDSVKKEIFERNLNEGQLGDVSKEENNG